LSGETVENHENLEACGQSPGHDFYPFTGPGYKKSESYRLRKHRLVSLISDRLYLSVL
jgi:hypothetical protein